MATEQIVFEVDEKPAVRSAAVTTSSFEKMEKSARSAGSGMEAYFTSMAKGIGSVVAVTAAHAAHAKSIDVLQNSYRALRIAASPTIFTAITLAAAAATEEVIRLTYAQGKLVEMQAGFCRSSCD